MRDELLFSSSPYALQVKFPKDAASARANVCNLRKFESLPCFGGGVVNPYLQHREAALKFNSALSGALLRLEFCLNATVNSRANPDFGG
jgi:hypothetical protein